MGLLYEEKSITKNECIGFACNRCLKEYRDDMLELQEMLHKTDVGGYGSVFGDGVGWKLTLCQHCVVETLNKYIKYDI